LFFLSENSLSFAYDNIFFTLFSPPDYNRSYPLDWLGYLQLPKKKPNKHHSPYLVIFVDSMGLPFCYSFWLPVTTFYLILLPPVLSSFVFLFVVSQPHYAGGKEGSPPLLP